MSAERQAQSLYLCGRFPRGAPARRDPSGQGAEPGGHVAFNTGRAAEEGAEGASGRPPYIAPRTPTPRGGREQRCSLMRSRQKGWGRPRQRRSQRSLWRLTGRRSPIRPGLHRRWRTADVHADPLTLPFGAGPPSTAHRNFHPCSGNLARLASVLSPGSRENKVLVSRGGVSSPPGRRGHESPR